MMNIKQLRLKTGLSQKEFGARLGLSSQSITKFEGGSKITETVKRLIRYEFADYLPEESRLIASRDDMATPVNLEEGRKMEDLKQKIESLNKDLSHATDTIELQKKTIALLEDQVQLYKDKLEIKEPPSKTA